MTTGIRSKSKRKPNGKKLQQTGRRILVEDLRVGDRIVTSWHSEQDSDGPMTDDEVMNVLRGEEARVRYVNTSAEVKKFEECPGKWRTHVHVNGGSCYDMRQFVWIVNVGG